MNPTVQSVIREIRGVREEFLAASAQVKYRFKAWQKKIVTPDRGLVAQQLSKRLESRGVKKKEVGRLRIFLAASVNNWERVLPVSLAHFGEVIHFDWPSSKFFDSAAEWLEYRRNLDRRMLAAYTEAEKTGPIDVFMGYVSDFNVLPETLHEIAARGAVLFNFSWDDKLWFSATIKDQAVGIGQLVSSIDLNLTNAPSSLVKYAANGGLAMFWPEAAEASDYLPHRGLTADKDVVFMGSRYGWRGKFVASLIERGVNVETHGNGWPNGPIADEKVPELFSRARVILGFSSVANTKRLLCLKGRDFEAPMAGAIYMTQHNPELELVYKVGQEILTFTSLDDCVQKLKWVKQNPADAEKIRVAGHARALQDHTWQKRFYEIFAMAGLI